MYNCKHNNQIDNNEYLLKICAIGSGNTGKTLFIRKFAENKFDTNYLPTLGVDITTKKICFNNTQAKLILVDTAGQEFFGKLRPSYYRGASAGLIFCNINDRKSIEEIPNWIKEFRQYITANQVPIGIVVIRGWKFRHRRRNKRKEKSYPKIKHPPKRKVTNSVFTVKNQILSRLRFVFKMKTKHLSSPPIKKKRKYLTGDTNALAHLTNLEFAKFLAQLYQIKLYEIEVDNSQAIADCFAEIARKVINP